MSRAPWDYLFLGFNDVNFHPLYTPTWQLCVLMIAVGVFLYNLETRRKRNYTVIVDLWERLLWATVGIFGMVLILAVFAWDFLFIFPLMVIGIVLFIWLRFVQFPPLLQAYEQRLSRERYFQRSRTAHPQATIRPKAQPATKRRRRR